nr:hypothetical protein [Tanacetum cinerariifolium]
MLPALQKRFESYPPQLMLAELKKMFEKPLAVEIYDLVDALHSCKQAPGKSVSAHVLEMKGYMDQLHALGKSYDNDMAINLINMSLNKDFGDFVRNFNMHCVGKTATELHALVIDFEKGLKDNAHTPQVLTIQKGRETKPKPQANKKDKSKGKTGKNKKVVPYQPKPNHNPLKRKENPNKDQTCHHCHIAGHSKRNCLLYLEELRKNKDKAEHGAAASSNLFTIELFNLTYKLNSWVYDTGCGIYVCNTLQGFKEERKLSYGEQYLGVVSLSCLLNLRFNHTIASNGISVSLNGLFYFSAVSVNEVELQLGKKIKALRSDRGGEYLSQEFKDYLSKNGIVQHLTSPYTLQQNGVSERRNRTLLDMVRSMFNLMTLPLYFWDYALESAVRILNMVPTKKFYFPPENNVIVARYGNFLERDLISQKSERTTRAPNRLCLNIEVEDDEVGDLGEPINYKAAMLGPDKVIWQGAMDEEMNSMKVMKQASRQWNKRFNEEIKKFGFIRDELYVYRKASGSDVVFLILYVDDILIMENNIPRLKEVTD